MTITTTVLASDNQAAVASKIIQQFNATSGAKDIAYITTDGSNNISTTTRTVIVVNNTLDALFREEKLKNTTA